MSFNIMPHDFAILLVDIPNTGKTLEAQLEYVYSNNKSHAFQMCLNLALESITSIITLYTFHGSSFISVQTLYL